ncbi:MULTISPECIES: glutamate 5-kinase [Bacillus]|uniref:Glutamate 5-kinase n=1 Tax=Bacillus glycinifermentans TaxID=1664069 RepID=A0AAJ4D2J5_9BACI|nr:MULTISPECIES: glutamate 5-kinase [Bacillus]KKB73174.1 gamma-glutamyl kinase [Bacillus sp. TH008]MDU0071453.1 glutamate 5-kinase [Bacillus sp. IG6]MED8019247.1 glutamate 5-kinase [Bacillus glycinifermentans]NUJ15270.1 glutamate 5-kinase [Bacillus glycinifermentans]QAT65563.1 glutamate 5-kinase [Bacillus glycinifermentans]
MTSQQMRVVVKVGSSSLTSLHGEISSKKLEKLVEQIVRLKDEGHEVLLVSSGAVAAGYRKLGLMNRPVSLSEKQASASVGQGLLIEAYSKLFLSHGYIASQILITRGDFSDEHRYNNVRNTMNVLLKRGIIPIINENDTVTVNRLKFGDNDTLSAKVAGLIDADLLTILSDIDGLYDANPRNTPDAGLIKEVHEITPGIEASAGDAGSDVGTGGMKSKLDAFKITMASGIKGFLGSAGCPDILHEALKGTARGTYFKPNADSRILNHKKQWIAFNSGPEGDIIVSNESKESIIDRKKSLYPSSIYEINGRFNNGSVVRILDQEREEIGLGVVNFSSSQLRKWKKEKNEESAAASQAVVDREAFVCHLELSVPL